MRCISEVHVQMCVGHSSVPEDIIYIHTTAYYLALVQINTYAAPGGETTTFVDGPTETIYGLSFVQKPLD